MARTNKNNTKQRKTTTKKNNTGKRVKQTAKSSRIELNRLVILVLVLILIIFAVNIIVRKVDSNRTYYTELEDGTKENNSRKLKSKKKLDVAEVKDIQITSQNGISNIEMTVKNTTSEKISGFAAKIQLVDKEGNEDYMTPAFISDLEAKEEYRTSITVPKDLTDAYDMIITKNET